MLIGLFALTVAALFTGAAFYVNFAEQPARLGLKDRPLLAEWKPSYRRGFTMQAPLALIGFILGAIAWWQTGKLAFLAGALLIAGELAVDADRHQANQRRPDGDRSAKAGPKTRGLIVKWARLHAVRTVLGALRSFPFSLPSPPVDSGRGLTAPVPRGH